MSEKAEQTGEIEEQLKQNADSSVNNNRETSNEDQEQVKPNPLIIRIGIYLIVFVVMVLSVWGIGSLIIDAKASPPAANAPTATVPALSGIPSTPEFSHSSPAGGVVREADLLTAHTTEVPERYEATTYTVVQGDTIYGIAEKFGLKPESVLWSNHYKLGVTPDGLSIGFELDIFPMDGAVYQWVDGDGLNGVSKFFSVDPDEIVNYPGNNLDPETIGNYSDPNIEPGTMLFIPGGTRPNLPWVVARDNPVSGNSFLGPGACSGIIYGNVGTGSFTWPTAATWLSGYDWNPPVHNGLDFDGDFGSPIYAADSGVIVYSGWSDRGYGYLIVVDHESGWQTFYGHLLEGTLLPCGTSVTKGQLIASMGSSGNSTGPHLHFELRLEGYPVNPWLYLY
jgi:LysM repeat protein